MLRKEQINLLNKFVKGKWSLDRKTGLVNVNGSFEWVFNYGGKRKNIQGIHFGYVTGHFSCFGNDLTSLEGAPIKVGGDFVCSGNNLTSLRGAPTEVGGWFSCHGNNLTSLEGAPTKVGGNFDCQYNELTSLKGAPIELHQAFNCANNRKLKSLEGVPQRVGKFNSDFLDIYRSVVFNQKNLINFYLGKSNSNVIISNYKKTRSLIFPLLKKETLTKYILIDF